MIVMLLLNSSLFSLQQKGVICFTDLALLTDLFFRSETAFYLLFKEMIKLHFVWTEAIFYMSCYFFLAHVLTRLCIFLQKFLSITKLKLLTRVLVDYS